MIYIIIAFFLIFLVGFFIKGDKKPSKWDQLDQLIFFYLILENKLKHHIAENPSEDKYEFAGTQFDRVCLVSATCFLLISESKELHFKFDDIFNMTDYSIECRSGEGKQYYRLMHLIRFYSAAHSIITEGFDFDFFDIFDEDSELYNRHKNINMSVLNKKIYVCLNQSAVPESYVLTLEKLMKENTEWKEMKFNYWR